MKLKSENRKWCLLFLVALVLGTTQSLFAQWSTVRVGGGGYVTSIQAHPKVQNLYFITTDVGTPYRWNSTLQRWEGMFYSLRAYDWGACQNIAFDPSDASGNILYTQLGGSNQSVFKSVDRGNTWYDCNLHVEVLPNTDKNVGQRLAVDPQNSNVVYVTTRSSTTVTNCNGTFRSLGAGESGTWSKLNNLYGNFICFDISSGKTSTGVTKTIYLGCTEGVYRSTDGGETFTILSGGPTNVNRGVIHSDGTLYVTYASGVAKWTGSAWVGITPSTYKGNYQAVDVNPQNSAQVIVGVRSLSPYRFDQFVSKDGGTSWTAIASVKDITEIPWFTGGIGAGLGDFCWDPFDQNMVWFTDYFNAHQTTNIWAGSSVTWKARAAGEEETCAIGNLLCPPSGTNVLHSCAADVGGWDHTSITESPKVGMTSIFPYSAATGEVGNMTGVAVQETNPNFIARVGRHGWSGSGYAGYSTDGGATYTQWVCPTDAGGGRIAVSATSESMVWLTQSGPCYQSDDRGVTWTAVPTIASSIIGGGTNVFNTGMVFPLAADKVNGNKFYIYRGGVVYVSSDKGKTFAAAASNLPYPYFSNPLVLETTPGKEGDIWLAMNTSGLYHSTNSGATFTKVSNVTIATCMAIGKSSPDYPENPSIYVYGTINNISNALFRSVDNGASWEVISSPLRTGTAPYSIAADRQVYGRVFVATSGNGILCLQTTTDTTPPTAPTGVIVSAITTTSCQLQWAIASDNVYASAYDIYKDGVKIGSSINLPYFKVTGLTAGTSYSFTVKARDAANNVSVASKAVTVVTPTTDVTLQNIALNKPIKGSSEQAAALASYANDGNTTTRWAQGSGARNEFLTIDLGANYDITGTETIWESNYYIFMYKLEVSKDSVSWTLACDRSTTPYYGAPSEFAYFKANGYRYIRITVTNYFNGGWRSSLYEFKVYGTLSAPNALSKLDETKVRIYPNPASEYLSIENLSSTSDITVTALNGMVIYRNRVTDSDNITLPLSSWTKGIYLVRVKDANGVTVNKVIVE